MQPSDKWSKALMQTLRRLQTTRRHAAAAGYSPKQILEQLLLIAKADSRWASARNLSLQLRAALRRAVGEGLLKLRAGRYTLAVADKRPVDKKEPRRHSQQRRAPATVNDSLPVKTTKSKSSKKSASTVKKRVKANKSSRSKR